MSIEAELERERTCPFCEEMPLRSDATAKGCELCGMAISDSNVSIKIGKKVLNFCCDICLKKFLKTRFDLKRKHKGRWYNSFYDYRSRAIGEINYN